MRQSGVRSRVWTRSWTSQIVVLLSPKTSLKRQRKTPEDLSRLFFCSCSIFPFFCLVYAWLHKTMIIKSKIHSFRRKIKQSFIFGLTWICLLNFLANFLKLLAWRLKKANFKMILEMQMCLGGHTVHYTLLISSIWLVAI